MMLRLMKREPVWPMIPYLAAASLALTAWASRGHAAVVSGMYVSMSVALLSVARIWQRGTLFEAALPVDARELLGARVAALLLYVWTPILTAVLTAFVLWPQGVAELARNLGALGAAMSLCLVVMQTIRLPEIESKRTDAAGVVVVVLAVAGLALWAKQPWIVTVFCLVAAVVWGAVRWPREAFSYQCAPGAAGGAARRRLGGGESAGPGWLVVARALFPWQSLLWLGCAALFPLLDNVFFPLFYTFAYLEKAMPGMNWLFTLPVPRRKLLAVLAGTYVLVYAASFLAGVNYGLTSRYSVMGSGRSGTDRLGIPFHYWEIARGPVETITAPWGETLRTPAKRFLLWDFYNPYAVEEGSTPAFRKWQYGRAAVRIYGVENIRGRKPLMLSFRMQFLMVVLLASLTMVVFGLALLPRWRRFQGLPRRVMKVVPGSMLLLVVAGLAMLPLAVPVEHGSSVMLEMLAVWVSEVLPGNPVAMMLMALGGAGVVAAGLARVFEEVEILGARVGR